MKRLAWVAAAICVSLGGQADAGLLNSSKWVADRYKDPFTDVQVCRVRPEDVEFNRLMWPGQVFFYPFVETQGSELQVGVYSGLDAMPVGDVQMRVDDLPMVVISVDETPVPPGQFGALQPRTTATGDKARELLDQMRMGKKVLSRRVSATTSPPPGGMPLGASFRKALAVCGL